MVARGVGADREDLLAFGLRKRVEDRGFLGGERGGDGFGPRGPLDLHGDAIASRQPEIRPVQPHEGLDEAQQQQPLAERMRFRQVAVEHLEVVEAVQGRVRRGGVAAQGVAAVVDHGATPRSRTATRGVSSPRIA
jgi:hypothetical protein